jgi:hypothetical protein
MLVAYDVMNGMEMGKANGSLNNRDGTRALAGTRINGIHDPVND